jgi:hypothetical protein
MNLRSDFCFYLLYYLGIEKETLETIKKSNYYNGELVIGNKQYDIPSKYKKVFETRKNTGFTNLQKDYISPLGKLLEINNLLPSHITKARKQNTLNCPNCGKPYLLEADKWKAINNLILCNVCFDELSKNENIKKNVIYNRKINLLSEQDKSNIELSVSSFDAYKSNMPKVIDYAELNRRLEEIGKLGEKYVYEYEVTRLKKAGSDYHTEVDDRIASNPSNGYDILSYDVDGSEVWIEVKTTTSIDEKTPFFMSKNQIDTMENCIKNGVKYRVYRVLNIWAENKDDIQLKKYDIVRNGEGFIFEDTSYKITKQ